MAFSHKVLVLCLAACSLQACGGSSGSTGSAAVTQPVNGTFTSSGIAVSAATTTDPATGGFHFDATAQTVDPVLEFEIRDDVLVAIRVDDSAVDIDLDLTDPTTQFATLPKGLAIANADMSTVAVFGFDDRRQFEFQSYGAWLVSDGGNMGTVGSGSFGDPTPTANVPTRGVAYRGGGSGIFHSRDGEVFATSTDVFLWVLQGDEFIQIQSEDTVGINLDSGVTTELPDLDILYGTGRITDNGFRMEGVLWAPLGAGVIVGSFYGPEGQEVGGTFSFEAGSASHIGAFGAAQ